MPFTQDQDTSLHENIDELARAFTAKIAVAAKALGWGPHFVRDMSWARFAEAIRWELGHATDREDILSLRESLRYCERMEDEGQPWITSGQFPRTTRRRAVV
jgi:hypothetical protein